MRYGYIDPDTQAVMTSSEEPINTTMWWHIADDVDPNQLTVDPNGDMISLSEIRSYPWQEWNFADQAWIDTRPEDEKARVLSRVRQHSSMSRTDFVIAVTNLGILTVEDAVFAVKGEIPTSLNILFEDLSVSEQIEAKIRWAGATIIERMNPLILIFAEKLGLTEEQLDSLFGVS